MPKKYRFLSVKIGGLRQAISFDLKSGYHHLEVASEHQTFLSFSWKFHQA